MRRIGCLGFVIVLALIGAVIFTVSSWGGPGPLKHNVSVIVPPGASMKRAADELEKAGAVASADGFVMLAKLLGPGAPIRAGEYRVPAHLSQRDILAMLQGGKTLQRFVTIPEGLPSVLVQQKLMQAPQLAGRVGVPVEGTVLPDSYAYDRGDSRQKVLDRMQQAMLRYLAAAWEKRKPGIAVSTPREALILASIVEKETGKPSERRMVAAVYSNRLKRGMPLQADPTFIYPITRGRPLGRRPFRSECVRRTPTIPMRWSACRSARSPIPAAPRSTRCSIPPRRTHSTSWRTGRAGMCSPTRSSSTMPMSRNGMRCGGRGGRCSVHSLNDRHGL
jgi:UPF0755 protein